MRPCESCNKEFEPDKIGQPLCAVCLKLEDIQSGEKQLSKELETAYVDRDYYERHIGYEIDNIDNAIALLEDRRVRLNRVRLIADLERVRQGLLEAGE